MLLESCLTAIALASFLSGFWLIIIGISLFLEQNPPRQFSFIYKTPNYFLTFLLGPRGLSGTVQLHEKKFQRQCFAPSSHLISAETGNAAETSCKNKSKFLWILPSKCIRGISYRHSWVVVLLSTWQEKQGGRELSRRMPQPSVPFLPLVPPPFPVGEFTVHFSVSSPLLFLFSLL